MEIDANLNVGGLSNLPPATTRSSAPAEKSVPADVSFANSSALIEALRNTPDVRPEAVARGQQAVSGDGYPPSSTIKTLSSFLAHKLSSQD
jgi:hypothetical protein